MKIQERKFKRVIVFLALAVLCLSAADVSVAQQVKWLSVTDLQCPINSIAANYEAEYSYNQNGGDFFTWPAQFGIGLNDQSTMRMEGIWIGVKDYNDPVAGKVLTPKVVSSGPRNDPDRPNEIFPVQFTLIGKWPHPSVTVDNSDGSFETPYDEVDQYDPAMAADRMVVVKFNTSVGITVTRKVMVFANSVHGNYFVNDWTFVNTGIYNASGQVKQQTLDSTWFYLVYRYAFSGEGNGAASEILGGSQSSSNWASFQSEWGNNTLNHDFGNYGIGAQSYANSSSPLYQMRGFYSYYGPDKDRTQVTYDEDWGCPAQTWDGRMSSAKFAGNVTLHADASANNPSDAANQPATTWFIASDLNPEMQTVNQYDLTGMASRWQIMSEGHPALPHDTSVIVVVGGSTPYASSYPDARRYAGGGTSQGQGYGPYTMAPGDSVHIVYAQAVGGLSRTKNLEVGANWLQYFKGTGTPDLIMPNGSSAPKTLDGANAYKKAWVFSGRDSLISAYRNAMNNYASGYRGPHAPQPPQNFVVTSLGDRISLQWSEEAESDPHFNGYVIYRSEGTTMNPLASYEKVKEFDRTDLPAEGTSGMRSWDDTRAARGFEYYYYLQTKDDGTQVRNPITNLPETIYSSLEWTITVLPATLKRPPVPPGPLPFTFSTMKWMAMHDQGGWNAGAKYGLNDSARTTDAVTYNNATYVYVNPDSAVSAVAPDHSDSLWKKVTPRGNWVSGSKYDAYDEVVENGGNYYTAHSISGGLGLDLVRVVPNPYDSRARSFQYGTKPEEQDKINFFGLPTACKLKIFTERGDLIYSKDHFGSGDETWFSTTSSGQIVSSGIYILYVETPDGQKVFRKFIIIR